MLGIQGQSVGGDHSWDSVRKSCTICEDAEGVPQMAINMRTL